MFYIFLFSRCQLPTRIKRDPILIATKYYALELFENDNIPRNTPYIYLVLQFSNKYEQTKSTIFIIFISFIDLCQLLNIRSMTSLIMKSYNIIVTGV